MAKFKVRNQDVDGSSAWEYKKRENAVKKFESMLGYSMANAIDEVFWARKDEGLEMPKAETIKRISSVGHFGNRVSFMEVEGAM